MTEEAQDSEAVKKNDPHDSIEPQIKAAMISRVSHFKEQADSLTFEGVRRLIEKDLGLETHALDVHKKFIKQCLLECMDGAGGVSASKDSAESAKENVSSTKEEEKSPEGYQSAKDVKEPCPENYEKMEDSPVLGLMTGNKKTKFETEEAQGDGNKEDPNALISVNMVSMKVTMAGLRRILEEDLKLDKFTLDSFKKMISQELDEVLKSSEVLEPSTVEKKKSLKKNYQSKAKEVSSEGSSDSSDGEVDEEDEMKPRKKIVSKGKVQNNEGLKKRKRPEKETKASIKKKTKAVKIASEDNNDAESGSVSDDGHSQSSSEKPIKKKVVSTPAYGKRVEHLKTVIKSCGMSIPPSVYKKVKQAPENKREAQLIKELEGILSREGLSSNPSEKGRFDMIFLALVHNLSISSIFCLLTKEVRKEIKEVKKKKERARELEGIDMSNIVSSSRRRSATSFVPPPKPKIPDESESGDSEDSDDEDNDSDDSDDEDNEEDDGNDDGDAESKSEERMRQKTVIDLASADMEMTDLTEFQS
ncbi:CHZ domain-containing protein [Citrus sinensis]|uniref:CHZ domain-containing protein n=1 Tax=Citrus sinensis TaxID=2711 RepID=A0ACB8KRJ8_CITSI|nr:CHZ domain-containing protein [Citrus sinensis]